MEYQSFDIHVFRGEDGVLRAAATCLDGNRTASVAIRAVHMRAIAELLHDLHVSADSSKQMDISQ